MIGDNYKNKYGNLVFGSAGCGRIFASLIPSNHREEAEIRTSNDVKVGLGEKGCVGGNGRRARRARNPTDFSSQDKRRLRKIFTAGLGGHQNFLISELRRRGSLGNKCQLQVIDDPVHYGIIRKEGDDLHRRSAPRLLRFIMLHLTFFFIK